MFAGLMSPWDYASSINSIEFIGDPDSKRTVLSSVNEVQAPQHLLCFFPVPHGQGSLRPPNLNIGFWGFSPYMSSLTPAVQSFGEASQSPDGWCRGQVACRAWQ